jgi:glutathione S-transferase
MKTTWVDLETARSSAGLRLVTLANAPSPWSEAAKNILHLDEVPFVATQLAPGDKAVREWTRSRNAPVAMLDGEPPRTGWAEILELAERLSPEPRLVPREVDERVHMFGLAHLTVGEGGIVWYGRLLAVHVGLTTGGERGFPVPVAEYLAGRYGYAKERIDGARHVVTSGFAHLAHALGTREYFLGRLTALDVYVAAGINVFQFPGAAQVSPMIRAGFESSLGDLVVPASLLAHRDRMYERHLDTPG